MLVGLSGRKLALPAATVAGYSCIEIAAELKPAGSQ